MSGMWEMKVSEGQGQRGVSQPQWKRWLTGALVAGWAAFSGGWLQAGDKPIRHVVVFTTSDYSKHTGSELPDLKGNQNEGEEVAKLLGKSGNYQNRIQHLQNTSETELYRSLGQLKEQLGANDELIVYLSGHGFENTDDSDGALIMATVEPKEQWVNVGNLARALGTITEPKKLLIVDTCRKLLPDGQIGSKGMQYFNGQDISQAKEGISRKSEAFQMNWNLAVIYACQSGGDSNIFEGRSLFNSALLKAVSKEDGIPLAEVFELVRDQVMKTSRKIQRMQVPELHSYIGAQHRERHVVSNWSIGQRDESIGVEEGRKLELAENNAPKPTLADVGRTIQGSRGPAVVNGATRAEKVGTGLQVAGSIAGMAGAGRVGGYLGTAGTAIKFAGSLRRR
mgnify:FL=1